MVLTLTVIQFVSAMQMFLLLLLIPCYYQEVEGILHSHHRRRLSIRRFYLLLHEWYFHVPIQ